jgi:hypothetical protein
MSYRAIATGVIPRLSLMEADHGRSRPRRHRANHEPSQTWPQPKWSNSLILAGNWRLIGFALQLFAPSNSGK